MLENVNTTVGALPPTEEENSDMITIPRSEYNKLVFEREEYRTISLGFKRCLENIRNKAQANTNGGAINE